MKIALATCRDLPEWEIDDRPLEAAFQDADITIEKPVWDDDNVNWSVYDACLIRTTWDYSQRRARFVNWAQRVAGQTLLLNSAEIVRWNTDKRYLRDLESAGVPTIPTRWLEQGEAASVERLLAERNWDRAFLKPVVGASSVGTMRFRRTADDMAQAQRHLDQWLATHAMMLQPYYESVETEGEYSVIFVEGEPTHAVRKTPVPGDYRVQDDYGAHDEPAQLNNEDIRVARRAVAGVAHAPLYARADFLRCPDGVLRMNELELVEPSLFFRHSPTAAVTLAHATIERVRSSGRIAS
ncbi:MAG TPA: hypothetical protein P5081_09765 [Phycisphaerae bacterium]|nr:hypothetical protein [Phycisphaerae bacterium]HRW53163.1 hypothetical protein [Phycisphaerae bacterium]